jgi:hypothetical protein
LDVTFLELPKFNVTKGERYEGGWQVGKNLYAEIAIAVRDIYFTEV